MTLERLQQLIDENQIHHAAYRGVDTAWEGLWIYEKGMRGFGPSGAFLKDDDNLGLALEALHRAGTEISGMEIKPQGELLTGEPD